MVTAVVAKGLDQGKDCDQAQTSSYGAIHGKEKLSSGCFGVVRLKVVVTMDFKQVKASKVLA